MFKNAESCSKLTGGYNILKVSQHATMSKYRRGCDQMIFSPLNHHKIFINSVTECMWPLQDTKVFDIAASKTALYAPLI